MKAFLFLVLGASFTLSLSAHAHKYSEGHFVVGNQESSGRDVLIPKELTKIIENLYIAAVKADKKSENLTDLQITSRIPRMLMAMKVYLKEVSKGVLKENTVFELPTGGGEIDLAQVLGDRKGSFHLGIELLPKSEQDISSQAKVFFVSNHTERAIDGKTVGMGCRRFVDLSKGFATLMKQEGLKVNTTAHRHVSMIAGTFVFAIAEKDALHLATLTLTDSRYPSLLCHPQ